MQNALQIGASLFSFAAAKTQEKYARAMGDAERQQAEMVAEDYRIRAAEEDADRLRDFYGTLGQIEAGLAGGGIGRDLDSGTGQAIEKALREESDRGRTRTRGSYLRKSSQASYEGKLGQFRSRAQAFGYKVQGITSLFSAAQSLGDTKIGNATIASRLGI